MIKKILLTFFTLWLTIQGAYADVEQDGYKFEPVTHVGSETLHLNGVGTLFYVGLKVSAVGLYTTHKISTVDELMADTGNKKVVTFALRDLSSHDISNIFLETMRKAATKDEINKHVMQIIQVGGWVASRDKVPRGSTLNFEYDAKTHITRALVENVQVGEPIEGDQFFRMMLRIWLGPTVRESTRMGLLGQAPQ